jgi:hypothetical protein
VTGQPTGTRLDLSKVVITAVIGVLVAALAGWLGPRAWDVIFPPDPPRQPVRVLLAIDISGSQSSELRTGDPRTRIEAAQEWAPRALDSLGEQDQLGIATFSTSGRCPRRTTPADPPRPLRTLRRCLMPKLVVPIRSLTTKHKHDIKAGLAGLRANAGGTPLHQTIAWGVKQLQENWADGTKQALVLLTNGDEHASDNLYEQALVTEDAEARLKATDRARMAVIVLGTAGTAGTAGSPADCEDRRPRFYDECYCETSRSWNGPRQRDGTQTTAN